MKFTMFKKETTDKEYHNDIYRAVNFKRDENGNLICLNGKNSSICIAARLKGTNSGGQKNYISVKIAAGV